VNFAEIAKEMGSYRTKKSYMYMVDLSTEPRWQHIEGTLVDAD
jgi:beta-glucosidase-like glycosyl hydrolase